MNVGVKKQKAGQRESVFIIAEVGVNHNGKLALAKKMVDKAKKAGADAVKFQTFKAEDLVTQKTPTAKYQKKNTGEKESQMQMLKKLELSNKDFKTLRQYCDKKKILFLSTPHTLESVDFLNGLMTVFKIASGDLTNIPLLRKIAKLKKTMIVSTGMATMQEITEAILAIKSFHNKVILLHCTSNYPTPLGEVNLRAMETMKKAFKLPVGYSDHTQGIEVSLAAVSLGACVIEKHFTLDRNLPGPDHKASLEPGEFAVMVRGIRNIEQAMGSGIKKPYENEVATAKVARKSIVANADIKRGQRITKDMLAIKRPGTGLLPKYVPNVIGKIAKKNIKKDSLIKLNDVYNK